MKVISEESVHDTLLGQFPAVAKEGAELVGCDVSDDPLKIMTAINEYLSKPIKKKWFRKTDNWGEKALPIGTLWAETFVRELGWEWITVNFEDESQAIGVFNQDRSLGFYPWHFVLGVVENGAPSTILLAWNMYKDGAIPELDLKGYMNLMDGVHHIVPA